MVADEAAGAVAAARGANRLYVVAAWVPRREEIGVGSLGRVIGEEALSLGMDPERVCLCPDNQAAIECLLKGIQPGDYVLIKGSRGVQMEEIVAALGKG